MHQSQPKHPYQSKHPTPQSDANLDWRSGSGKLNNKKKKNNNNNKKNNNKKNGDNGKKHIRHTKSGLSSKDKFDKWARARKELSGRSKSI